MSENMTQLRVKLVTLQERAEAAEAELEAVREDNHSMMLEIHNLRIERDALAATAPSVPKKHEIEGQLSLAESEMINAKAWSAGYEAKRHIGFAMTAIGCARDLLQSTTQAAPSVPEGCAIVSRTLTPEAWKRLCNADIWPVTPKSFQRMLDVLMEVALLQFAPQSGSEPVAHHPV